MDKPVRLLLEKGLVFGHKIRAESGNCSGKWL